ncbi:MAG: FAD-binding oxidoreductase [Nostocoides sp.]
MTVAPPALNDLRQRLDPLPVETHATVLRAYSRDAFPPAVKADVDGGSPLANPVGVVRPRTTQDVVAIVNACRELGVPLVPYGGGSGICGSALATEGGLVLDSKLLNVPIDLDPEAGLVTVGAGMMGTELEFALNARGFTCGHSPQSVGSSTVGGWVAHRGAGVFSTRYGKIDDLVQALEVVLPSGAVLNTIPTPTSAAGPDLNGLFLGSEGTLGVITRVTLKVFPLPDVTRQESWAVADLSAGLDLGRRLLQAGYRPAVLRLYDPVETAHLFPELGLPEGRCIVLVQVEGDAALVDLTVLAANSIAEELGAIALGTVVGQAWSRNRFSTAGLVSTLQASGGIADALEVVNTYGNLARTYTEMSQALTATAAAYGADIEVYGHASHFYDTGANLYMIFHVRQAEPAHLPTLYDDLVEAALSACRSVGGSITHHHGVGISKSRLMNREWGAAGIEVWRAAKHGLDPTNFMNPGDKVVHRDLV